MYSSLETSGVNIEILSRTSVPITRIPLEIFQYTPDTDSWDDLVPSKPRSPRIVSIIYHAFSMAYIPIASSSLHPSKRSLPRGIRTRMIGVQIKARLVHRDRSSEKDFSLKRPGIFVATKESGIVIGFEIIPESSNRYLFPFLLEEPGARGETIVARFVNLVLRYFLFLTGHCPLECRR